MNTDNHSFTRIQHKNCSIDEYILCDLLSLSPTDYTIICGKRQSVPWFARWVRNAFAYRFSALKNLRNAGRIEREYTKFRSFFCIIPENPEQHMKRVLSDLIQIIKACDSRKFENIIIYRPSDKAKCAHIP